MHAEGDQMPGCIIDVYNNVAVFQFHSIGMWKLKEVFNKITQKTLPNIELIYDKSESTLSNKHKEEYEISNSILFQKKERAVEQMNSDIENLNQQKNQKVATTTFGSRTNL